MYPTTQTATNPLRRQWTAWRNMSVVAADCRYRLRLWVYYTYVSFGVNWRALWLTAPALWTHSARGTEVASTRAGSRTFNVGTDETSTSSALPGRVA